MGFVGAEDAADFAAQVTVAVPAGVRDGDRMLLFAAANDFDQLTSPSGWELVRRDQIGTGTAVWVYERTASAEPADYTLTWDGSHWHFANLVVWRGRRPVSAHAAATGEGVTTLDLPPVTAGAGDLLVAFGFHWDTAAKSWPGALTEVTDQGHGIITAYASTAGGATPGHTLTADVSGRMAAVAVLMEPAPSPAGVRRAAPRAASPWRYYAMRATSGEWLHRDLPLLDVKLSPELTGPYRMTAVVEPEYADLVAGDGDLLLAEWGTVVLAEAAGQLRGGGIVTDTRITGSKLQLTVEGISAYPQGMPLTSTLKWGGKSDGLSGYGADPFDVIRALWGHLQAYDEGDLGVTVTQDACPYRLGAWHNARQLDADGSLGDDPKAVHTPAIPIDKVWDVKKDSKPVAASGKSVYWLYQLAWWDGIDIGQKISELARQMPFDFREQYRWADSSRESVVMEIELGYPRVGRRQSQLRFVEGENVSELVAVTRDGADYANTVYVMGAGEGSKQFRQARSHRDGSRLRRVKVLDRPEMTSKAAAQSVAADELRRVLHVDDITGFQVRDHPNAPVGSFDVGDDVLVEARRGWRPLKLWVRITGYDYSPDTGDITVRCSRSDRFRYGGA